MQIHTQPILSLDEEEPKGLISWVNYELSLTDRLEKLNGSAELELLSQNWVIPSWWERHVLKITDSQIFQREIMMRSHGKEYWYARTLIPQASYNLNPHFFNRLQKESIKNLIFDNPEVERQGLRTYAINAKCLEFYWIKKHLEQLNGTIWVRFADYLYTGLGPFYLLELLLPELEQIA
ncbi:MAG: chorismate lyase [Legionella sp.]|nr:MAG: chorismate lyase [Legionella sp.]